MRVTIIIFLVFILVCQHRFLPAQTIRKNYREMTAAEKLTFVEALTILGPRVPAPGAATVISRYCDNHEALMNIVGLGNFVIHRNDDFLPWHRWFILYFEKELRTANVYGANKIAMPYWDWTSKYYTTSPRDNEKSAPLWTQSGNFLYQFDNAWDLDREPQSSVQMGTVNQLEQVLGQTNFSTFRNMLEGWGMNNLFHNNAHVWVGGRMVEGRSPGDPAFYLNHAMVDKVWQDWVNLGRVSSFPDETLPNKGGSSVPNFPQGSMLIYSPVPNVSPTSIIDGRASNVKVWYAENGKVILDKYTVPSNEKYYYTGIIEAGSRVESSVVVNGQTINYLTGEFVVPNARSCWFVSGGLQMGTAPSPGIVKLVPGFKALRGSTVIAKINSAYFTDAQAGGRDDEMAMNDSAFEEDIQGGRIDIYPNPTQGIININFKGEGDVTFAYTLTNMMGTVVLKGESTHHVTLIDATDNASGIYVLSIIVKYTDRQEVLTKRIIIK